MPTPALGISHVLRPFAPRITSSWYELTLSHPTSQKYSEVMIRSYNSGYSRKGHYQSMEVWFDNAIAGQRITSIYNLDIDGDCYLYRLPSGTSAYFGEPNLASLLACMKLIDIDTTNEQVQREANQLLDIVRSVRADGPLKPPSDGFVVKSTTSGVIPWIIPDWVEWSAFIFWVLVWLAGCVYLVNTNRKRGSSPSVINQIAYF